MKNFSKLVMLLLLLSSCSSKKPPAVDLKALNTVKVEYKDVLVKAADKEGWIGGSYKHPVYYTYEGGRIHTHPRGLIVPRAVRTVTKTGDVIYPDMGYKLLGDVKVIHFLALVSELERVLKVKKQSRPLALIVDSNRLTNPAVILDSKGAKLAEFVFRNLRWELKR
jgi:hypothetical protein